MLSLAEVKAYGLQYKTVPVSRCMYADIRTPVEVMRILKNVSSQCYLLESMEDSKRWGRYTFLGYDPQMELACKDGTVHIRAGTDIEVQTADPASFLRQVLADNAAPRIDGLPPFTGGLVGYVAYDYIQYAEPSLHLEADDDEDILDFDLFLFDKVIVFDHLKQTIFLIANVRLDGADEHYQKALLELEQMERLIRRGKGADIAPLRLQSPFPAHVFPRGILPHGRGGKALYTRRRYFPGRLIQSDGGGSRRQPLRRIPRPADDEPVAVHVLFVRKGSGNCRLFSGNAGKAS